MSVSFGALGILAVRTSLLDFVLGDGQLRSVLGAFLSVFVIIVLAYLTNPTENSFRTYLTEQSFRQHLSRLDEPSDDGLSESDNPKAAIRRSSSLSGSTSTSSCETGPSSSSAPDHNSSQFHFANRASVSLRTPKHAFNSFGIFTIAAVIPIARHNNSSEESRLGCSDPALIPDSWFIGAFGKWWRGGLLEAWYHGIVPNSKHEEGWSSGILGIKALDRRNDFNGLPFTTPAAPSLRSVGVAPKLRNRERSQPRQKDQSDSSPSSSHHHSNKTSLLPLHAPRTTAPSSIQPHLSSNNNNNNNNINSVLPTPSPASKASSISSTDAAPRLNHTNSNNVVLPLSRTPSSVATSTAASVIDNNPSVIDLLRQISHSKSTTAELRTQLADFQSTASAAHAALQADVDACRERKKAEDAAKTELKARTKTLDDQRRAHEAVRRDAEKRLRAAQTQREHASARMASLDKEITALERRLAEEEERAEKERGELKESEGEIGETLKMKRKEIAVAEDVVAALGVRAKELEEMVAREKERLRVAKEKAEMRRQDESFIPRMAKPAQQAWPPVSQQESSPVLSEATIANGGNNGTPTSTPAKEARSNPQRSPKPGLLSLGALSNFSFKRTPPQFDPVVVAPQSTASSLNSTSTATTTGSSLVSSPGFAPFDHGSTTSSILTSPSTTTQASQPTPLTTFSPFDLDTPSSATSNGSDNSNSGSNNDATIVGTGVTSSLSGTTLIPSSLIQSLDGKSTSTENVAALARWDTRASDSIAIAPASASAARRRWFDHQRGSRSSNSSSNSGGGHGSDNGAPGTGVGAHQLVNQVSRSFQSDNDVFLEPDWRVRTNAGNGTGTGTTGLVTASPTSYTGPVSSFDDEVYVQGQQQQQQRRNYGSGSSGGFGSATATTAAVDDFGFLTARARRSSLDADQTLAFGDGLNSQAAAVPKAATVGAIGNGKDSIARRWYSVLQSSSGTDKEAKNNNNTNNGTANSNKEPKASSKKGLNPDAKVFRLTRKKSLPSSAPAPVSSLTYPGPIGSKRGQQQPFDLLNPTSLISPSSVATAATTSTTSLLLRAFAPSPAEREALQRALGGGGSTNASLERLPSLSDVGSIPPSPELAARGLGLSSHHPHHQHPQQTRVGGGNGLGALPAWLHPFQRVVKKPAFSPWDDDEPVAPPAKTANSSF